MCTSSSCSCADSRPTDCLSLRLRSAVSVGARRPEVNRGTAGVGLRATHRRTRRADARLFAFPGACRAVRPLLETRAVSCAVAPLSGGAAVTIHPNVGVVITVVYRDVPAPLALPVVQRFGGWVEGTPAVASRRWAALLLTALLARLCRLLCLCDGRRRLVDIVQDLAH